MFVTGLHHPSSNLSLVMSKGCFIFYSPHYFEVCSPHLAYHMHKSGHKTFKKNCFQTATALIFLVILSLEHALSLESTQMKFLAQRLERFAENLQFLVSNLVVHTCVCEICFIGEMRAPLWSSDSVLDHRSLLPMFESRCEHI